jgi:hypothetical protein
MTDNADLIKRISDALNSKGVRGACPMCGRDEWMIEGASPYSRTEVTDEGLQEVRVFKGFYPTYWLHCGNCGFVAQFMKSVVDDESDLKPEPLE